MSAPWCGRVQHVSGIPAPFSTPTGWLSPQKTLLCIFDLTALLGTALLVFGLRATYGGLDPILYKWVLPLLLLGPVLGSSFGIYQSISLPPQRELKALFLLTCLTYSLILAVLFLAQAGDAYSRLVIAGSWAATVFTLPIMRGLCRRLFAKNRWWGRPLIILDRSDTGRDLWRYLKRHPDRGLTPVGIFALPEDLPGLRRLLATAAKRHPGAMILIHHKMGLAQPWIISRKPTRSSATFSLCPPLTTTSRSVG